MLLDVLGTFHGLCAAFPVTGLLISYRRHILFSHERLHGEHGFPFYSYLTQQGSDCVNTLSLPSPETIPKLKASLTLAFFELFFTLD